MGFPHCAKACQFDYVPLVYFCFYFCGFGRLTWENICKVDVRKCFYLSSLPGVWWCLVLYLSLSAILSLFWCMVWGCVLVSLIWMQLSRFPSNTCWKDGLFPILCSCLPCQRLIDHRCLGLFPGSLFCSIVLMTVLVPVPHCLDNCGFIILSEVWELCLLLGFCSSELLWQFWVFCGSI